MSLKCGKQKGTEMGNYPLTAKEQHKRKEKLAKIRQTVMIILMAIAGLYYMTVERGQVTNAAIMTNVDESTGKTNRNQDKEKIKYRSLDSADVYNLKLSRIDGEINKYNLKMIFFNNFLYCYLVFMW